MLAMACPSRNSSYPRVFHAGGEPPVLARNRSADGVRAALVNKPCGNAPRESSGDAGPARRAFPVLCSVAVLLLAGRGSHCTTDHTKVAVPEAPSVSVAVTVTV
jgi:hypothetical protein